MGGLVGGLLELVFWPPLPKSEVRGQVWGPVGDALSIPILVFHHIVFRTKFCRCYNLAPQFF
jgi:hypothetical protein